MPPAVDEATLELLEARLEALLLDELLLDELLEDAALLDARLDDEAAGADDEALETLLAELLAEERLELFELALDEDFATLAALDEIDEARDELPGLLVVPAPVAAGLSLPPPPPPPPPQATSRALNRKGRA